MKILTNTIYYLLLSGIVFIISCNKSSINNSVSKTILTKETDSVTVNKLLVQSKEYCPLDFGKAHKLASEALRISKKISYERGIATSYNYLGLAYEYEGNYDIGFEYYTKSIETWQKLGDKKGEAACLNALGGSFYYQGNYVKAKEYYLQSLNLREEINDLAGIGQCLNNLGLIFRVQKEYEKAKAYYLRSIAIKNKNKDIQGVMYAQQNLGFVFENINSLDSAIFYYTKSLNNAMQLADSITVASNLINISQVNRILGNLQIALSSSEKAEMILRKTNDRNTLAYCLESIGETFYKLNEYKKAKEYIYESLDLALNLKRKELIQNCYLALSKTYSQTGEFELAYNFHIKFEAIKDSIIGNKSISQLNELQTKYETVKKEQQIDSLIQEKRIKSQRMSILFGIAMLLLLSLIVIFLLLKQSKLKSKEHAMQLRQKLLRTQMNPHFIFNALGSIQSYIFYNKTKEAINYLSKFSILMRDILEGSMYDFIPMEQDIAIVENYLLLQQLRHEDKFIYKIESSDDISSFQIPPMLTQPFVENAVKHGVGKMKSGGKICIDYKIEDKNIIINIADNGPGLNNNALQDNKHKSHAISLTKQRLAIFGKGCYVKMKSPIYADGTGTEITINITKKQGVNNLY